MDKKKLTIIIVILGCAVIIFGTSIIKKNRGVEKTEQFVEKDMNTTESSEYIVTFIELGSVNCIPCKMMQPVMDEIKQEYQNQVKVIFYDVWTNEGKPYAGKYGIRVIPTQVFLDKEGNEFFRHEGFFSKEEIVDVLKSQGVKINA